MNDPEFGLSVKSFPVKRSSCRSGDEAVIASIDKLLNASRFLDAEGRDVEATLVKAEITTILISAAFADKLSVEAISAKQSSTVKNKPAEPKSKPNKPSKPVITKDQNTSEKTEVAKKASEYADILKILDSFKSSIELMPAMEAKITNLTADSAKIDENATELIATNIKVDSNSEKITALEVAMASASVATAATAVASGFSNETIIIEVGELDKCRVNERKRRGITMANSRKNKVVNDGIIRIVVKSTSNEFITHDLNSPTVIHANIPAVLASLHVVHDKVRVFEIREGKSSVNDSYNPSFSVEVGYENAENSARPVEEIATTSLAHWILANKSSRRDHMTITWRMPDEDQLAFKMLQAWKQEGIIKSFLVNKNCRYTLYFSEFGADTQEYVNLPDPANVTRLTTATKENIKKAAGRNYFVDGNGNLIKLGEDETSSDNW